MFIFDLSFLTEEIRLSCFGISCDYELYMTSEEDFLVVVFFFFLPLIS